MKRRAFCSITLAGAKYLFLQPFDNSFVLAQPPAQSSTPWLLAQAGSDAINASPKAAGLYSLPALFALTSGDRSPNAKAIQNALAKGSGDIDRQTLSATTDYFKFEDPSRYAHSFGIGVQVIGGVAAFFNPLAGLVVSVAGTMGEDMFKVVASGGDLSRTNPFIGEDKDATTRINQALLEGAASRYADNPSFRKVLDSPMLRERLGIDFRANDETLVARLPEPFRGGLRNTLAQTKVDLRGDLIRQDAAIKALFAGFSKQLNNVEQTSKEFGELLRRQSSAAQLEAARVRNVRAQADFNAGIHIATFLLGRATGDQQQAAVVGRVLSTMGGVAFALATGNIIGAISTGLGLFDGGGNDLAAVAAQVQALGQKIDQLRKEMSDRFDRLDRQQRQMLIELGRIYQLVREGTIVTANRVNKLNQEFRDYWTLADADKRASARGSLTQAFEQAMLQRGGQKPGWQALYLNTMPIFLTHARTESRQSYFRGAPSVSNSGQITDEVSHRKRAENLVGLIPTVCSIAQTASPTDLANPFELALGAEAYMQADILLGTTTNVGRTNSLLNLWNDATQVRAALNIVSSPTVTKSLSNLCLTNAGTNVGGDAAPSTTLVGLIREFYRAWVNETLKPRYTSEAIPRGPGGILSSPVREKVYGDIFDQNRVKNSSIDAAIKIGLIELREVSHSTKSYYGSGRVETWDYSVAPRIGPHQGKVFGFGTFWYTRQVYHDYAPGEKFSCLIPPTCVGPLRAETCTPNAPWSGIMGLMDYCENLLGLYYATDVLPSFPGWLRDEKGFDSIRLGAWSDVASSLRLATTVARWRQTDGVELDGQTDTRNVNIIASRADVIAWLQDTIEADRQALLADPAGVFGKIDPRTAKPHELLASRIRRDIELINDLPRLAESKCVPIVDSTLRRLAGYMKAHKIPVPIPKA